VGGGYEVLAQFIDIRASFRSLHEWFDENSCTAIGMLLEEVSDFQVCASLASLDVWVVVKWREREPDQ